MIVRAHLDRYLHEHLGYKALVARCQRGIVSEALHLCQGNKSHAAEMLGIHRNHLQYLLYRLGLEHKKDLTSGTGTCTLPNVTRTGGNHGNSNDHRRP